MPQTIILGVQDPNIAYLLQRYAEESGFQIAPICQTDNLPDLANHLQPALIVLDIDFIDTTDWAMVRRLKADLALRHLPIVVYSCLNEPPDDWREGVDGFLLKSPLYDDFVAVLKRATSTQAADETQHSEEQMSLRDAVTTDAPVNHATRPADEH